MNGSGRLRKVKVVLYTLMMGMLPLGCAAPASYMPLNRGLEWTYSVRAGFQNYVEVVKVGPAIPMGVVRGSRLESNLGTSEFGWNKNRLLVNRFANSAFSPPMPILIEGFVPIKEKGKVRGPKFSENNQIAAHWSGELRALGVSKPATAELLQRPERIEINGQTVETVLTILRIHSGPSTLETKTWFQRGKGIVQQEQRTRKNEASIERLILALELIGFRER